MTFFFNTLVILLIFVFSTKTTQAYLDPGTGSLIFQVVIGAVLAGAFTLKVYFHKVKNFILPKKNKKEKND